MTREKKERPLKICSTCSYWSTKYKGFCERLQHGVGKYHRCADWQDTTQEAEDWHNLNQPKAAAAQ